MDAEDFAVAERHLRSWICQTILRPLVAKIDEVNGILAKVNISCSFAFFIRTFGALAIMYGLCLLVLG